jgi:hypothetical protein
MDDPKIVRRKSENPPVVNADVDDSDKTEQSIRTEILQLWQLLPEDEWADTLEELVYMTKRKRSNELAWITVRLFEKYFGAPGISISLSRYSRDIEA